jgi:chemotaxis protein methyltransferase CheR
MTDAIAIADVEGLLVGRVGLRLDPGLRARLVNSIELEAVAAGMSLESYASSVESDPAAFQKLLNRVTVQQTSFFRDSMLFDALTAEVIPNLTEPVLAWSAGCSNGQEPYSLAMLLSESGLRDWTVVATDISTRALVRAKEATYSATEVASLGAERKARHMTAVGVRWEVNANIRGRVRFQRHNLSGDPMPVPPGQCQIILCRNVLIYFTAEQLLKVLDRFASAIQPAGHLFLGASESLWQLSDHFRLVRLGAAFAYQLPPVASIGERRSTPERREAPRHAEVERRLPQTVAQLLAAGEAAASAGDFGAAADAFRRATSLDPDHPIAYFQLAVCLEKMGLAGAAERALKEASAAIRRGETSRLEAALEGYRPDELLSVIELRLNKAAL